MVRKFIKVVVLYILFLGFISLVNGQNCLEKTKQMNELFKLKKIDEAIALGEKSLNDCNSKNEEKNYLEIANYLASLYRYTVNYEKAKNLYLDVIAVLKLNNKSNTKLAIEPYLNLGLVFSFLKKDNEAKPYLIYGIDLEKKFNTVIDEVSVASRVILSRYYTDIGDYKNGELFALDALETQEKISKNDFSYFSILGGIGSIYSNQGKLNEAEPFLVKAYNGLEGLLGKEHELTATAKLGLAVHFSDLGNYQKAEDLYKEVIETIDKNPSNQTLEIKIAGIANLGGLYFEIGDYEKSEINLKIAITLYQNNYGNLSGSYCDYAADLGNLYCFIGRMDEAEVLLKKALEIREKIFGKYHKNVAQSYASLGVFYDKIYDKQNAETCFLKSSEISKFISGENDPNYILSLQNLAGFYVSISELIKADSLYNIILEFTGKTYGKKHPKYATVLIQLADLYLAVKYYDISLEYYVDALEIQKEYFGNNNANFIHTISQIAKFYFTLGNYTRAEPLFLQALNYHKVNNKNSDNYFFALNYVTNHFGEFKKNESLFYIKQLIPLIEKKIIDNTLFFSVKELDNYLRENIYDLAYSKYSFCYPFKNTDDTLNIQLYNLNTLLKNLSLRNTVQFQEKIQNSNDTSLINDLSSFKILKGQLAKYEQLPIKEQPITINEIEIKIDSLEKKLVRSSQAFKNKSNITNTSWLQVKQSLKPTDAAIEFVSFDYYTTKWTDSTLYAAMLIRPGFTAPQIINLFEQKELEAILKKQPTDTNSSYLNRLYSNNKLYNLIVQPLDSLLQGVTNIYIAASGLLHNINLPLVFTNANKNYNVHLLGTTADVPKYNALQLNNKSTRNAYVFGGIDYDRVSSTTTNFKSPAFTQGFEQVAIIASRDGTSTWAYLPGTLAEVTQIENLNKSAGITTISLTGNIASETSFKNLNNITVPYTLHLATHGYFFEAAIKQKPKDINVEAFDKKSFYKWADDPLLRTGLILAGANKAWKSNNTKTDSTEDGILTAMEVASIDLSNCQLAVLSACETGLGDIKGTEGVFGLQRGFKLAGVKNIIMSLWKIPDAQSATLLSLFYKNCYSGLSIYNALKNAQIEMSKNYPPYFWAGFVLLE